ncbi:8628_t:CDS:2 [Diversispora eburnea]|uniref:8628_t:CDS:1 n=1 Tax=Diversispora eburnea TaxID=1213867 RepID=A0A9N9ALP0_9GLOM|nr:8628_t:CDS:2 [Diversispora eburnea]
MRFVNGNSDTGIKAEYLKIIARGLLSADGWNGVTNSKKGRTEGRKA